MRPLAATPVSISGRLDPGRDHHERRHQQPQREPAGTGARGEQGRDHGDRGGEQAHDGRADRQRLLLPGGAKHVLRNSGQAGLLRRRPGQLRLPMTTTAPQSMDAEAIWRDLHGPLLGFIARRVPDPETAEDILQEMMLRIHRYGAQGSAPESITAWLYGVARNAITDHYRRAVVRRERPAGTYLDLRETEAPPDPHPAEAHLELATCLTPLLRAAAAELPRRLTAHRPRRAHPGRSCGPRRAVPIRHEEPSTAWPQPAQRSARAMLRDRPRPSTARRRGSTAHRPVWLPFRAQQRKFLLATGSLNHLR